MYRPTAADVPHSDSNGGHANPWRARNYISRGLVFNCSTVGSTPLTSQLTGTLAVSENMLVVTVSVCVCSGCGDDVELSSACDLPLPAGLNKPCVTVTSPTSPAATPHHAKLPSPPVANSCGRIQVHLLPFLFTINIEPIDIGYFRAGVPNWGKFPSRGISGFRSELRL